MNTYQSSDDPAAAIPAALVDVALIDAEKCAAAGDMSVSWWHNEVRAGNAPQPVVRMARCTRWRLADVRRFWLEFAEKSLADPKPGRELVSRLKRASAAASTAKRTTTDR